MRNIDTDISQRLKAFRKHLGVSQSVMAQKMGIIQSNLSEIEREKRGMSFSILLALVQTYDLNANWLLTGKGEMVLTESESETIQAQRETITALKAQIKMMKSSQIK